MIKNDTATNRGDNAMITLDRTNKEAVKARLRELKGLAKKHDALQNEGGYGYNPYRDESSELINVLMKLV